MKKSAKVVIGVVVTIVVVIVAVSLFFPSAMTNLTSGTFGKADKYKQTQMTERDVILRSDLVADTGQLRSMIQGLIYFSLFTQNLSTTIDSCVHAYRSQGVDNDAVNKKNVWLLQDFSGFIKNNNKTLQNTISMLTGFYLKDDADKSADVERNLRDFGNYVNSLDEKDSVLTVALESMDNFLLTNKTLRNKKAEIASLKSIRDQLLLGGIELSGVIQDKILCSELIGYALSSQTELKNLGIQNQLGAGSGIASQDQLKIRSAELSNQMLGVLKNDGRLENASIGNVQGINATQLGNDIELMNTEKLGRLTASKNDLGSASMGSMVLYDKTNLQFIVCDVATLKKEVLGSDMKSIVLGSTNLSSVVFNSADGLKVLLPSFPLGYLANSQVVGSLIRSNVLSMSQLNGFLAHDNLGAIQFGSQANLGMSSLSNVINSSITK